MARRHARTVLAVAALGAALLPSSAPAPAIQGARPLSHFADKYFRADDKGRAALESKWQGQYVTAEGEVLIGSLYNATLREKIVVTAPDGKGEYLVMMRGRDGEWAGTAIKEALAGRRVTITGRISLAEYGKRMVWLEPSEVRVVGKGSDDLRFMRGYLRDLESGARRKRGFEGAVVAHFDGQKRAEIADFLAEAAMRDYPFERLDVPRIKETAVGIMGRMGPVAVPGLVKVVEAYRKRPGMYNQRVFGYAIVCLGDAGDKRAWKYAELLDRSSGVQLSCIFMLFTRSRDLLPEKKWTEILKMADNVLRMETDTATKRQAQMAMDAYTSGTWGPSPRHKGIDGR